MSISKIKIGEITHDIVASGIIYCTCETAAATAAKVATVVSGNFTLFTGAIINVKFTKSNSVASPTLNVANTGAKAIYWHGSALTSSQYWEANSVLNFIYNGNQWDLIGVAKDNNTTYGVATSSKLGLVKSGTDITVDANGNVQVNEIREQNKGLAQKFWRGTQAEYNAITTKDANTMYIVTDGTGEPLPSGDMLKSVYDPQNKKTDIFKYTDNLLKSKADLDSNGKVPISQLPKISSVRTLTGTIGTTWVENEETGVKSQRVAISGISSTHTAKVDHDIASINGTSDGYATFVEEENQYLTYITNGYAETYNGGIIFYIFGDAPTVNIPIVVEVA